MPLPPFAGVYKKGDPVPLMGEPSGFYGTPEAP
jgi:hypothetical protein